MTKPRIKICFCLATSWAGVRWSRVSSKFDRFADANREAMEACVRLNKPVRVYAFMSPAYEPDHMVIAEYTPVNGKAQSVPITE